MTKPVAKLVPQSKQVSDYATREYTNMPFLIHGRGSEGSDGCLVIERPERVMLLEAIEQAGGATLLVSLSTRPGDMLHRALERERTA